MAIYVAAPAITLGIMSICLQFSYRPSCLKTSHDFVLPKSGKADHSTPRSFRVILLLDTFSKILEKLVLSHLSATAHLKGLVSIHQAGSLAGVSAEDAPARLMHEIDTIHRFGLCATTGFFDIKGGCDNVSHLDLLDGLTSLGTPSYLVSWSESFPPNRSITLVYPGAPNLSV